MGIHQIFPKFAPRNQNITVMKITTFNPDGSIKEVREQHFQIPKYITSFDPNQSFLNIKDDDMAVFDCDDKDEQEIVVKTFKILVKHDVVNYIKTFLNGDMESSLIKALLCPRMDVKDIVKYSKVIKRFIRKSYASSDYDTPKDLTDDEKQTLNIHVIVEVLVHNLQDVIAKGGNKFEYYKSFFSQVHWLYYALNRNLRRGALTSDAFEAMEILSPFANLKYNKENYLDDEKHFKKIQDALYSTGGKSRADLYRLQLVIKHLGKVNVPNNALAFAKIQNELKTIINCIPGDVIENVKLQLDEDEVVALHVDCQAKEEIKQQIKNVYNTQYNEYINAQGMFIKDKIEQQALRYYECTEIDRLIRDDWRKFYFKSVDIIADKYKDATGSPYKYEIPLFYYYLLVEKCKIGEKYTFEGRLLNDLIIRAILFESEEKSSLYEQMYRLNYMEQSANLIFDERESNDKQNNDELLALLKGLDYDIVEKFRSGKRFQIKEPSDAVKYLLVWLEPLFERHLNNSDKEVFKEKFETLLKSDEFETELLDNRRKKVIKHNLNIKLVLNIVGMLSELNKENERNWVKCHIGPNLRDDIEIIWKQQGTSSYHKYVSGWDSDNSDVSALTNTMKMKIKEKFKR